MFGLTVDVNSIIIRFDEHAWIHPAEDVRLSFVDCGLGMTMLHSSEFRQMTRTKKTFFRKKKQFKLLCRASSLNHPRSFCALSEQAVCISLELTLFLVCFWLGLIFIGLNFRYFEQDSD